MDGDIRRIHPIVLYLRLYAFLWGGTVFIWHKNLSDRMTSMRALQLLGVKATLNAPSIPLQPKIRPTASLRQGDNADTQPVRGEGLERAHFTECCASHECQRSAVVELCKGGLFTPRVGKKRACSACSSQLPLAGPISGFEGSYLWAEQAAS